MKTTTILGKKYTVTHVFNMVSNWYFTDKNGIHYLVDGEDVSVWVEETERTWKGVDTVIEYAKDLAQENEGIFYWKVKQPNE